MESTEVHNTAKDLPPFKKKKMPNRKGIESDEKVINIIKTNLLLDKRFNILYLNVSKQSKEILKIIDLFKASKNLNEDYILSKLDSSRKIHKNVLKKYSEIQRLKGKQDIIKNQRDKLHKSIEAYSVEKGKIEKELSNIAQYIEDNQRKIHFLESIINSKKYQDKKELFIIKEDLNNLKKINEIEQGKISFLENDLNTINFKIENSKEVAIELAVDNSMGEYKSLSMAENIYDVILDEMINVSIKIQKEIDRFENNRKNDLKEDLNILSNTLIYSCKKCGYPVSIGRFRSYKCACGEEISTKNQTNEKVIHHFNSELTNFCNSNTWLEHGADYLLRRKDLDTWIGLHILGHSGVWHEIDNVAEYKKDNLRFFCECKSGNMGPNDVLVFSGKMADIGCTRGYIFTTLKEKGISKEIFRLARSKNIDIITDVLNKDTEILLKEIKEGKKL